MSRLSQPLNLRAHLRVGDVRMEMVPFLDMGIIALCFLLLDSPFITAPGVPLDLLRAEQLISVHAITVLTVKHDDLLIYKGRVVTLDEFRKIALEEGDMHRNKTLLVKPSKNVSLQILLDIGDAAHAAGFKQVQIAAEPK